MRSFSRGPLLSLTTTLLLVLQHSSSIHALPNPSPEEDRLRELLESRYHYLSERWCANPCGPSGEICCGSSQSCITNSLGQPQCSDGTGVAQQQQQVSAQGQWRYYTVTYVETEVELVTKLSTQSSYIPAAQTPVAPAISAISCNLALGEKPCGTICCASGQYCAWSGQCAASGGQAAISSSVYVFQSTMTVSPNTAPLRPTSNVATTITKTGSATVTVPFQTPSTATATAGAAGMTPSSSNNGLSGGAIAGIVIGVILGLFLFFLICAFLCCRSIIDAILDFFGLRNRRRSETIIEERYSRHSGGGGAAGGRNWFGINRPARVEREKTSTGLGGWATVVGGLGTLAVILGLKRRYDRRKEDKSEISSYSYSYDSASYTSPSSVSTAPRSQRTRDTRPSRR